jgi:hypothetical protein
MADQIDSQTPYILKAAWPNAPFTKTAIPPLLAVENFRRGDKLL